jgi:hypothetical protein
VLLSKQVRGRDKILQLNNFELNALLLMLVGEVEFYSNGSVKESMDKSPLYRAYTVFMKFRPKRNMILPSCTFLDFLHDVHEHSNSHELERTKYTTNEFYKQQDAKLVNPLLYGCITRNLTCYNNAFVYGVRLRARGKEFREIREPLIVAGTYGSQQKSTLPVMISTA